MANRNYKLRLTYSDGTTAKVILATYSLLVSVLVGLQTRNERFTYTASVCGIELDSTDYEMLNHAVSAWLDVFRAKAATDALDAARERELRPYLYTAPMTAQEAEALSF